MKQILLFTISTLVYSSISFAQMQPITCASPILSSCKTENSICYEFTDFDEDQAQAICENSEGSYQTGPCDKTESVLRCLQPQNFYMPFMVFLKPMERTEAESTCQAMNGQICE